MDIYQEYKSVFLFFLYKTMKIFLICSKAFYSELPLIQETLEKAGHKITVPHSYDNPASEATIREKGAEAHAAFKSQLLKASHTIIGQMDAVLALNFDKNGQKNYIGGSTFLELYEAFMQGKNIYLYNDIPQGMLFDEISGFSPLVLNGDLKKIPS
jgi:hypothetical protein